MLNENTYADFLKEWEPPKKLPNTLHSRPKKNTKKKDEEKEEEVAVDEELKDDAKKDEEPEKKEKSKDKKDVDIANIAQELTSTNKRKKRQPILNMNNPPNLGSRQPL